MDPLGRKGLLKCGYVGMPVIDTHERKQPQSIAGKRFLYDTGSTGSHSGINSRCSAKPCKYSVFGESVLIPDERWS